MAYQKVLVDSAQALNFSGPTIEFRVGLENETKSFFAHVSVLTSRSPFLANALSRQGGDSEGFVWREGEDGVFKLPEDDPVIVGHYLQLIYTNTIAIAKDITADIQKEDAQDEIKDAAITVHSKLIGLYIFCEKLLDITSKNLVMVAYTEFLKQAGKENIIYLPNSAQIQQVFDNTPDSSPLRRFMIDMYQAYQPTAGLSGNAEDWPHEFLFHLTKAVLMFGSNITHEDICDAFMYFEEDVLEVNHNV